MPNDNIVTPRLSAVIFGKRARENVVGNDNVNSDEQLPSGIEDECVENVALGIQLITV